MCVEHNVAETHWTKAHPRGAQRRLDWRLFSISPKTALNSGNLSSRHSPSTYSSLLKLSITFSLKKCFFLLLGFPVVVQWLANLTRNHEVVGSIPALAQWVNNPGVAVSCGVGCRCSSDPTLLWLWPWPVATAPIRPPPGNLHMPWEWP